MSSCSSCIGIIFVAGMLISPIIFGAIIANLKNDIRNLHKTPVVYGYTVQYPISDVMCVTQASRVASSKVLNVTSLRVDGNRETAQVFQERYMGSPPDGRKWCQCSKQYQVFISTMNKTFVDSKIDCNADREWAVYHRPVYAYNGINGSLDYESPHQKETEIQGNIKGFFVGIYICCGVIGFLIIGAIMHCLGNRAHKVAPLTLSAV